MLSAFEFYNIERNFGGLPVVSGDPWILRALRAVRLACPVMLV
jgi:hypothetical protein